MSRISKLLEKGKIKEKDRMIEKTFGIITITLGSNPFSKYPINFGGRTFKNIDDATNSLKASISTAQLRRLKSLKSSKIELRIDSKGNVNVFDVV